MISRLIPALVLSFGLVFGASAKSERLAILASADAGEMNRALAALCKTSGNGLLAFAAPAVVAQIPAYKVLGPQRRGKVAITVFSYDPELAAPGDLAAGSSWAVLYPAELDRAKILAMHRGVVELPGGAVKFTDIQKGAVVYGLFDEAEGYAALGSSVAACRAAVAEKGLRKCPMDGDFVRLKLMPAGIRMLALMEPRMKGVVTLEVGLRTVADGYDLRGSFIATKAYHPAGNEYGEMRDSLRRLFPLFEDGPQYESFVMGVLPATDKVTLTRNGDMRRFAGKIGKEELSGVNAFVQKLVTDAIKQAAKKHLK